METFTVKSCWGNFAFDFVHSDSVGNSGGILCAWDPHCFNKKSHTLSDYFAIVRGVWISTNVDVLFVVVYAPNERKEKRAVWEYLHSVVHNWDGEVIMMGDFNEVRYPSDRFGSVFHAQDAEVFNSFIFNSGLVEVPLGGCNYTWCHKTAKKMSKLDRFLMTENMLIVHPHLSAITLDRHLSDHRPILLREETVDYGPCPFKFYNHWLEVEGFRSFVEDTWHSAPRDGNNNMLNLMKKLRFLKSKIREWNKSYIQSKKAELIHLQAQLYSFDSEIDKGNNTDDIIARRLIVVNSIENLRKIQANEYIQKAKIKWAVEGDENSRFFHGLINKRRKQMSIRGVLKEGTWVDNPHSVKSEFLEHFRDRFKRPEDHRITFDMEFPYSINREQQIELESEVTTEEVKRAVWECGVDKSPGPDGFTFGFYRQFWKLVEEDVIAAVKFFFQFGEFAPGCNSTFITLIPKIPNANQVKDFRPISLIGSLYKIVTKILANRLVPVLGDIVQEVQSAFVPGRQIMDGPFVLNEIMQWCSYRKKRSIIFKVDFEKAYDSVRWDFLDEVLQKFGFGSKWRHWIQSCLKSSRGSILINGSPTEEFQFYKGLKQGDSLSPFLFILIMETLHISFKRVVEEGMFTGIKLPNSVEISHMFFADDAVFIGKWCDKNIGTLTNVLECFRRASGLKFNMSKSKIMGVHVEQSTVSRAANSLGCLVLRAPFTYLGTKVGGNMHHIASWQEVVNKVKERLSKWKMKALSIGGRLTLIKSVLGSIPIFHLSIYKAPVKVLKELESIRRRFFHGHEQGKNKATWIKWEAVTSGKDQGGLGVASLYALNRALICKWVWKFFTNRESLWTRVIKAIHGEDGSIDKNNDKRYMSTWSHIISEIRLLKEKGIDFFEFLKLKIGDGNNTCFWKDKWCADGILKDIYPRLYNLETRKDVSVRSKIADPNLEFSFRRNVRGGIEQAQLCSLTTLLEDVNLVPQADRYVWTLNSDGVYSVSSLRKRIDGSRSLSVASKTRWIKFIPIKINILAWKVNHNALPTRWNLSNRGINIQSLVCPVCDDGIETTSHLFFSCSMTNAIYERITRWWNIPFVGWTSYEEWLGWFISIRFPANLKAILEGVFYVSWWFIWRFRNKLLFDTQSSSKALLFDNIVSCSFSWCNSRCKTLLSWNEWLKNPYLISV
ncbi:RNA-directed DNA polymerase, eukaryota [Tanacetum coccineum]|uniref:RNA-directed DNA polymerase, eukaryota n=1 Tax=Tanacetum coccineum TaxID=301880 RepID=A0ABQ4WW86_9ASTR